MREKPLEDLERFRVTEGPMASTKEDGNNGVFIIAGIHNTPLVVIVSDGAGWEHVSVREHGKEQRCPTWEDMCYVKDLFWEPEEAVVQFHPPQSRYVDCHPFVLHMWKPVGVNWPLPPTWMVGPKR